MRELSRDRDRKREDNNIQRGETRTDDNVELEPYLQTPTARLKGSFVFRGFRPMRRARLKGPKAARLLQAARSQP